MASILPFDELNRLEDSIRARFGDEKLTKDRKDEVMDELLDLFLLAYAMGADVTGESLSSDIRPVLDDVMKVVDEKVAGKTWRQRTEDYFDDGGNVDDIVRIAETESHRIANTAALETAKKTGAKTKTWYTALDDKVRDTHAYLEGVTVGIDDEFITYDGDRAQAPGLFRLPENNINCRCTLTFN